MQGFRRAFVRLLDLSLMLLLVGTSAAYAETITGTVTNTVAAALSGAEVDAYETTAGTFVARTFTNAAGAYSLVVPAGSYFVRTFNTAHYVNQLYNSSGNLQCPGLCNLNAGSAVNVPAAGTVAGVNFALSVGAAISGTLRDEATSAPLAGVRVEITDTSGVYVDDVTTGATGVYLSANGLPTGSYHLRTDDNTLGYINEVYPNVPCLLQTSCSRLGATNINVAAGTTSAGRDLALRRGGLFSGAVTDAVSGIGLENIGVEVLNTAGQIYVQTLTDASGAFGTRRGVPTGSYYLRTFNAGGYINRFNDGTVCVGTCSVATLESIGVVEGATTFAVNFALGAGGRIAGTVRDVTTLVALPNVDVQVLTTANAILTTGVTDSNGDYVSSDGLPSGSYFVRTNSVSIGSLGGYVHELFNNVTCAAGCNATLGAPVSVFAGATTGGIDFDLERGGRIGGVVVEAGTGALQSSVQVAVLNAAGTSVSTGSTDATGRYLTAAGLVPGSYFLRTISGAGFISEVYPDVACLGTVCPTAAGTAIAVAAGATTTINVDLVRGGRFRGNVLDATTGAVVTAAQVSVLDATGQTLLTTGAVGALGDYLTGAGLPAGFYFARTANSVGYINELYANVPCHFGCRVTDGTPISVTVPNITNNINFRLSPGGEVTGHVNSEVSGLPLANVTISLFNPTAQSNITATSDSTGEYVVGGLPDGVYYARTTNTLGYVNEAYNDIPCVLACNNTTLGQPLTIVGGAVVVAVDFALRSGGRVSGTISDSTTGLPLSGVTVSIVDAAGATVATATSDLAGSYVSGAGILSGNYFAVTTNTAGYQNELYNNIPCLGTCTFTAGTAVAINEGATTPGINFALGRGGRISGHVTDDASGAALQNVTVAIFDASGRQVSTATTDAGGSYITGSGLTTGSYFARTTNALGYVDERYNDQVCPSGCSVINGTSFAVVQGVTTPGISFGLIKGGRIAGVVTDDSTGQPLGGVTVQVYDATGQLITQATTSVFGVYTSGAGLASGTYHARTTNNLGYINELEGGAACIGTCVVTAGAGIVVASPATTAGIDFALAAGGRVSGRVTDLLGAPLRNVTVRVADATGASLSTGVTNAVGDYLTTQGLLTGSYYVRTTNGIGYVNALHSVPTQLPCLGNCDVTAGAPVLVNLGATTLNLDFQLEKGAQFRGVITRADATPIPNVTVSVVNAAGTQVTTGVTGGGGTFVTGTGAPAGNYFAVTQNSQGLVNEIFDNIPCIASCVATTGTTILGVAGAITPGIDFVLEPDTDPDLDGIAATIDTLPAVFSNDFTDVPLGGTTSGTISGRNGWTALVGDVTPGGVQLQVVGSGAAAATFDVCPLGDPERVTLDVLGEIASVSCDPVTGSTTIR